MSAFPGIVLFALGVGVTWGLSAWWRHYARTALRWSAELSPADPGATTLPAHGPQRERRTADAMAPERIEARDAELTDDLRGYLDDVAVHHGAEDAMFWIRASLWAPFVPIAWNHPGAPPETPWGTERARALVAWAAGEDGVVSFDVADGAPTLVAVHVSVDPVAGLGAPGESAAALVLYASNGIRGKRDTLKYWLPRHAERLAQLVELQVTRNEVARQNRRMRALMRDAHDIQAVEEQEALEQRIASSVLEASGATFAALVRWDAELRRGTVRHATALYPAPVPAQDSIVDPDSLVGGVCLDGTPRIWEDARAVAASDPLYGAEGLVPRAGMLAILPLKRGRASIGALVIGSAEPGAIRRTDLRTAHLLTQLAASALEAAWEIQEVSLRAHTDQLTGLWNRRHFDEQLARILNETDRFGGSCALVLADIDFFKAVNDTHGHEAGDAVLKAVAEAMRELVRTTDICARIGGEEVSVILPQTSLTGALELAERLRMNVGAASVDWRSQMIQVTASFGVAVYEAGSGAVLRRQLFEEADRALYQAKGDGRNCVRAAGKS